MGRRRGGQYEWRPRPALVDAMGGNDGQTRDRDRSAAALARGDFRAEHLGPAQGARRTRDPRGARPHAGRPPRIPSSRHGPLDWAERHAEVPPRSRSETSRHHQRRDQLSAERRLRRLFSARGACAGAGLGLRQAGGGNGARNGHRPLPRRHHSGPRDAAGQREMAARRRGGLLLALRRPNSASSASAISPAPSPRSSRRSAARSRPTIRGCPTISWPASVSPLRRSRRC